MKILVLLFPLLFVGNIQAQDADSIVMRYLTQAGVIITKDNNIELLKSGTEKFNDLFAHVRQARHHVHMEYFNFRNDSIGKALFTLLTQKAKEGVEVRLMFDAFGNASNNRPLKNKDLKVIRSHGIEIFKFDPITFPYINHVFHRDHRKIVVIDGVSAYTGGMNVADYYIRGLPKIGEWRDMHFRVEGGAARELQRAFLKMWEQVAKERVEGENYYPIDTTHNDGEDGKAIAIVERWPKTSPKLMRRAIAHSIRSAQYKVQIVNPYFVPTKSIKKAIKGAIERGVDVQIMVSAKSDVPFTLEASLYASHKLMKKGANVYMYNKGFHHSKIMMIDDSFCTIGSTNFNSRSLRYDYETDAYIFDKATTRELVNMFEQDKADSTVMTQKVWKERPKWKRFVGWFTHLFTPFI